MLKKAFLEITNACNLSCSFCHGTKREKAFITKENFLHAATKLCGYANYLYFHIMGEPLLHPQIEEFLDIAAELGFRGIITTNGTLLPSKAPMLLKAKALHKVSISLHCYEANAMGLSLEEYLDGCFDFCAKAAQNGIIAVMRLWNAGGEDKLNELILNRMHNYFKGEWKETYSGYKICEKNFLEWGERFDWPDIDGEYFGENHTCYGLRDQIGVLCDGTVVPCCLDADGAIPLGNIFESELSDILNSKRAQDLKRSLQARCVKEELCLRCGYAHKKNY